MSDNLFQGLPPPSAPPPQPPPPAAAAAAAAKETLPPRSALKSALKRSKPLDDPSTKPSVSLALPPQVPSDPAPEKKRLRFKTTTDASETQVIEAMQKIASHIKSLPKFSKASKLAIQMIQAGSVKAETTHYFFHLLESAMSTTTACNDPSARADYHALFTAAQDAVQFFSKKQMNQFRIWVMRAVLANDLFTDDSFVFSKATGQIKEAISNLPGATTGEDIDEAVELKDDPEATDLENRPEADDSSVTTSKADASDDSLDPFGLDALVSSTSKKDERAKRKKEATIRIMEEENINKRFLKLQREALIACLEIAARRYKTPWCQTSIDILVKHAFDNISKFTSKQRDAIDKLWASIREQQIRRKQGKSVSGKLDVNGFELLQEKYSNEKISIRRAVGGSGDRKCTQWLG